MSKVEKQPLEGQKIATYEIKCEGVDKREEIAKLLDEIEKKLVNLTGKKPDGSVFLHVCTHSENSML